jgi:DNA repair protein RecO (recombination protein O)
MNNRLPHLVIPMETRVTDQAGFILRRREWRNSSLILDIFSRDHGCLRMLAKGARRGSAPAYYQPFVMLNLNWSGRQELKTLTGIDGQALPIAEENYLALLYANELITLLLPPAESNPDIFAAYLALLQHSVIKLDESRLRIFELVLLQRLGYFPDLYADATNGEPIRATQRYQFIVNSGFVSCADTAPNSFNGQVLLDWCQGDYQQSCVLRLAKTVLRTTIDFNLHGKTLKSRDVYAQMMRHK